MLTGFAGPVAETVIKRCRFLSINQSFFSFTGHAERPSDPVIELDTFAR